MYHYKGSHHKEALKILKLAVTRSSTLAAAPLSTTTTATHNYNPPSTHTSFAEAEMFLTKKELPGQSHKVNCTAESTPDLRTLILLKHLYSDFRPYSGFCRGHEDSAHCWK